jgi:hypothetical protein
LDQSGLRSPVPLPRTIHFRQCWRRLARVNVQSDVP